MCAKICKINYTKGSFLQDKKSTEIGSRTSSPCKYPIVKISSNQRKVKGMQYHFREEMFGPINHTNVSRNNLTHGIYINIPCKATVNKKSQKLTAISVAEQHVISFCNIKG